MVVIYDATGHHQGCCIKSIDCNDDTTWLNLLLIEFTVAQIKVFIQENVYLIFSPPTAVGWPGLILLVA